MSGEPLTALQWAVLRSLGRRAPSFFLSGGAALAGFHLHHRPTTDLDFFTVDGAALDDGLRALRATAAELGAVLVIRHQSPGFIRAVVDAGADAVVIDLVYEQVRQLYDEKLELDGVRVDPLEEVFVNKLTALVGRQEERDLVDLWFMEQRGLRVESFLPAAEAKDGGCTPSNLAWLLSTFPVPPDARLPPGLTSATLRAFRDALVERLTLAARPT
jgi:predicted nucleotidyltransferase component of viral defense system